MRHGIVPEHNPQPRQAGSRWPAAGAAELLRGPPDAPAEAVEVHLDRIAGRFLS